MAAVKAEECSVAVEEKPDLDALLGQAISETRKVEIGRVFLLRDLFLAHVWDGYKKGDRLSLGRNFKQKVEAGKVDNVIYVGKAQNNSATYRKIESPQEQREIAVP